MAITIFRVQPFALVSILLVAMCSLSGIILFFYLQFALEFFYFILFIVIFVGENFAESCAAFSVLQIPMIPWIQMVTLLLLLIFINGHLMAMWLVL